MISRITAAAASLITVTGCLVLAHPAAVQDCPPGQAAAHCVKGTIIIWEDPAHPSGNQLIQEDNSGAPQFWVGVGGAASGANPFCVTDRTVTRFKACLGGPWGNGQGEPLLTLFDARGRPVTLTVRDIRYLHWLERAVGRHRLHP